MERRVVENWSEGFNGFCTLDEDRGKLYILRGERYLLLHRSEERDYAVLEVSAGRQISRENNWEENQLKAIVDFGCRQQRAADNYRLRIPLVDLPDWHSRILSLVEELFKTSEEGVCLVSQSDLHPSASGVEDAMNYLAKERTWQARTGLYRLLLGARLLVLVDGGGEGERTQFRSVDSIGGFPVACAFTDYDRLDALFPLGVKVLALPGDILFPELIAAGMGAMRLNPGSSPHGELYANELAMIVEGLKKMRGVH